MPSGCHHQPTRANQLPRTAHPIWKYLSPHLPHLLVKVYPFTSTLMRYGKTFFMGSVLPRVEPIPTWISERYALDSRSDRSGTTVSERPSATRSTVHLLSSPFFVSPLAITFSFPLDLTTGAR